MKYSEYLEYIEYLEYFIKTISNKDSIKTTQRKKFIKKLFPTHEKK